MTTKEIEKCPEHIDAFVEIKLIEEKWDKEEKSDRFRLIVSTSVLLTALINSGAEIKEAQDLFEEMWEFYLKKGNK